MKKMTETKAARCRAADLMSPKNENDAEAVELMAKLDGYFRIFAAPQKSDDGKQVCLNCNQPFDGMMEVLGLAVAHRWAITHGEANCSGCGWPSRGMHYPKDDDGEELLSLRNFFLQYHPDEVSVREDAA